MSLSELAEICERAKGPDRELDCRLWAVVNETGFDACREVVPDFSEWQALPYTSSLDAAMTLVPTEPVKGLRVGKWWWMVESTVPSAHVAYENGDSGIIEEQGEAATPALALCAAALRARDAIAAATGTAET